MQERGLGAYLAELIGTFLLVFFIVSVVVLFVSTGNQAQFGSDFAVVGLVHAFLLFGLIVMFGVVSGGHFNPAVTLAALAIKRISPIDGLIYMLAQLSGPYETSHRTARRPRAGRHSRRLRRRDHFRKPPRCDARS